MTPKVAALGEALSVPIIELQTQTLVVYGGKGMGKTNLGADVAEELAAAGLRFAWLDPVGVAWGLKHSSDGKTGGIEVLILGGIHGDIPITPAAGEIVADLVVDEGVSVVVDISRHSDGKMWSAGEKIRFVRDYCTRLFMRQGENRRPLMQIIDEAGRFVPQQMPKGALDIAECVGAIEQLVELGRNVGVGVMLITQRSARMNKSVSELAEMMIAFRTVGPNSIDAIMDWFGDHVPKARQREHIERIRQLPRGTALIVSPGWLGIEGEYEIRRRRTFDSSDTPRAGEERRVRGKGAQVDVGKYRDRMSEVEAAALENNPKALRKKTAEYERELAELRRRLALEEEASVPDAVIVEVPTIPAGLGDRLLTFVKTADTLKNDLSLAGDELHRVAGGVAELCGDLASALRTVENVEARSGSAVTARPALRTQERGVQPPRTVPGRSGPPATSLGAASAPDDGAEHEPSSGGPHERILNALGWWELAGRKSTTRLQVAAVAGYHPRTASYLKALADLNEDGRASFPSPGLVALTDAGRAEVDRSDGRPVDNGALHAMYYALVESPRDRILREIIACHPEAISRAELAERTGYHLRTGSFLKALGYFNKLGITSHPRPGYVVATGALFLGGS